MFGQQTKEENTVMTIEDIINGLRQAIACVELVMSNQCYGVAAQTP